MYSPLWNAILTFGGYLSCNYLYLTLYYFIVLHLYLSHDKIPQTQWLKASETYHLTVSISPKSSRLWLDYFVQGLTDWNPGINLLRDRVLSFNLTCWQNSLLCACVTDIPIIMLVVGQRTLSQRLVTDPSHNTHRQFTMWVYTFVQDNQCACLFPYFLQLAGNWMSSPG